MANERVLTAPLAVIKVNGITIGKMKNIRCTESLRRGRVVGLGQLLPDELPVIEWSGQLTCSFFNVSLKNSAIPGAINRLGTADQFVQTVLLQEDGVQIDLMKRVKSPQQSDSQFPNVSGDPKYIQRNITGILEVFASVKGAFLTSEGFDVSEGGISGRDCQFEYTTPILYSL
jgi:hypothetical protein